MDSHNKSWNCYLAFRLFLGVFDFITDILQSAALLHLGHTYWGILTLCFPIGAFLCSAISTLVAGWGRGNAPMSFIKFAVLTLRNLATLFEGLFESGPELVLQTLLIFHGVHLEDVSVVADQKYLWTWPWFRGVFHLVSIMSSALSLLVTLTYFNEERLKRGKTDSVRFVRAVSASFFSVLFRVFLAAVMFSVAPWISLGLVLLLLIVNTSVSFYAGLNFDTALLSGYASLFAPSGYAKNHGSQPDFQRRMSVSSLKGKTSASLGARDNFSEVERAKINQESLLKQVKITHGTFMLVSLILIVPYVALLEVYLFPDDANDMVDQLSNRMFLYITPSVLFLLSNLLVWLFMRRIRVLRNAARHWFAITPHRNRHNNAGFKINNKGDSAIANGETLLSHHNETSRSLTKKNQRQRTPVVESPSAARDLTSGSLNSRSSEASTVPCYDTLNYQPSAPVELLPASPALYPTLGDNVVEMGKTGKGPGTFRCGRPSCVTCELFIEGSDFTSMMTGKTYKFMKTVTCEDKLVIYLITCNKCKKQYVGKTEQSLKQRHYGHRREMEILSTPLGKHFAVDCGYANWKMQVIDQSDSGFGLKRKEGYWQHELSTLPPWGLNTRDEKNSSSNEQ